MVLTASDTLLTFDLSDSVFSFGIADFKDDLFLFANATKRVIAFKVSRRRMLEWKNCHAGAGAGESSLGVRLMVPVPLEWSGVFAKVVDFSESHASRCEMASLVSKGSVGDGLPSSDERSLRRRTWIFTFSSSEGVSSLSDEARLSSE